MPSLLSCHLTKLPALCLFIGGFLVFSPLQPSSSQTPRNYQLSQGVEFNQQQENTLSSQPLQISQLNSNFQRYLVYVDSDNPVILQQVQMIDNSAYIRPYNGRNIIQSGVFLEEFNAVQRARELQANGIGGVQIVTFSNTEAVPYSVQENQRLARNDSRQQNSKYYYVVIPTTNRNLRPLAERIRQRVGQNSNVYSRTQPRGAHIAVGPFAVREDAEQWNSYLQNIGYRDARVYYGR